MLVAATIHSTSSTRTVPILFIFRVPVDYRYMYRRSSLSFFQLSHLRERRSLGMRTYARKPGVESILARRRAQISRSWRWLGAAAAWQYGIIKFNSTAWHSFDSSTMSEAYSEALGWCAAALCLKNMLNHLLVVRCRVSKESVCNPDTILIEGLSIPSPSHAVPMVLWS